MRRVEMVMTETLVPLVPQGLQVQLDLQVLMEQVGLQVVLAPQVTMDHLDLPDQLVRLELPERLALKVPKDLRVHKVQLDKTVFLYPPSPLLTISPLMSVQTLKVTDPFPASLSKSPRSCEGSLKPGLFP